jgi:hypothetical protein
MSPSIITFRINPLHPLSQACLRQAHLPNPIIPTIGSRMLRDSLPSNPGLFAPTRMNRFQSTPLCFMSKQEARNILGVENGSSKEEIQRKYRAKALQCHPDITGSNDRAMQQLTEARARLMDPQADHFRKSTLTTEEKIVLASFLRSFLIKTVIKIGVCLVVLDQVCAILCDRKSHQKKVNELRQMLENRKSKRDQEKRIAHSELDLQRTIEDQLYRERDLKAFFILSYVIFKMRRFVRFSIS